MRLRKPQSHILIPTLLFLAALALRLYRLDAQSLWLDEGSSWQMTRLGWGSLLADMLNPTAAYPLYHVLLKGWVTIFGDSEVALRLPSAIAGAGAVVAIYAAAREVLRQSATMPTCSSCYALAASSIALVSPFTLWYAQEAKAYSFLLLGTAFLVWSALRALRTGEGRDWVIFGGIALLTIFVHRLALLLVVAGGWAWLVLGDRRRGVADRRHEDERRHGVDDRRHKSGDRRKRLENHDPNLGGRRQGGGDRRQEPQDRRGVTKDRRQITGDRRRGAMTIGLLTLVSAGLVGVMTLGLGSDRAATGAYIPAGPLTALGLTFTRFSLDRWPGDVSWWWLLPWGTLFAWGLLWLGGDARRRIGNSSLGSSRTAPTAVFLLFVIPLGLFLAQLLFTRLYEARYLILIYPLWVLVLAYPLVRGGKWAIANGIILLLALGTGGAALVQPPFGLFSGVAVKEQYREAINELAMRVHPDDAVVIHPAYLRPLYDYYMGRMSRDPAPVPLVFADFWQGETSYGQREWDIERHTKLAGYTRSFLLIAPEHARTVDAPAAGSSDEYGLVGNFWAFSREQRTWPCGIWRYNGAHLFCQEAPETYITGVRPDPVTPMRATFDQNLQLIGYSLKATNPDKPGVYRAGGNVPISLFWNVVEQPTEDLSFFLHLCQDCTIPPVASNDGPPLEGYLPTTSWVPGKPARDDRAIQLPFDMPAGRYTLLLGVYRPNDPAPSARLTVRGGEVLDDGRLVIGTVEITRGE